MATAIMKCRVCGKPYEACHTLKRVAGVFRWQEVACSPECGSIYLAKIEASRAVKPTENKEAVNNAEVVEDVTSDDYGIIDYDDLVDDEDFVIDEDLDD
ncbi:MAG: hypothetical protein IJ298_04405 [Ruminococcus sp.]|nr:hypothetical protein [Ruminococcus sp.]